MKKQYNRPQTRVVGVRPVGLILVGTIFTNKHIGINALGTRESQSYDDEPEEESLFSSNIWADL